MINNPHLNRYRTSLRIAHAEWSEKTFGPATAIGPVGPLRHLAKEAIECAYNVNDLSEWADIQMLFWDALRRADISEKMLLDAVSEKLKINKQRQWPEPKDGEPREHLK